MTLIHWSHIIQNHVGDSHYFHTPSRLSRGRTLIRSKFLEGVQVDLVEGGLVCCVQLHPRYSCLTQSSVFVGLKCFEPSRCAQTPFATTRKASNTEVVSLGRCIVEEFLGNNTRDSMVTEVSGARSTVPIPVVSCHGRFGKDSEWFLEYCPYKRQLQSIELLWTIVRLRNPFNLRVYTERSSFALSLRVRNK